MEETAQDIAQLGFYHLQRQNSQSLGATGSSEIVCNWNRLGLRQVQVTKQEQLIFLSVQNGAILLQPPSCTEHLQWECR